MFKTIYTYWLNHNNNNTLKSKINLWYLKDIRSFNVMSSSNLSYLVSSLNAPKIKLIKTVRANTSFDNLSAYTAVYLAATLLLVTAFLVI